MSAMRRAARLTLLFAVLFAFFLIAPAYLNRPFGPYPLLRVGNILDLFTPLVLIPLYWLLFEVSPDRPPARRETLVFLVLAALWVMGHSTHLAGNAIGHLTESLAETEAGQLTHFIDEVLSHYLWLLGIIGLAALILYRQWRHPFAGPAEGLALVLVAAAIHGLNYFLSVVEAGTNGLGIGFAVAVVVFGLLRRRELGPRPQARIIVIAYAQSLLLLLAWGLYWGGLPEFSAVGLLD